jgi:hypothetical protein
MLGYLPNSYAYPGSYVRWISGPIDCGSAAYFNSLLAPDRTRPGRNATLTIYMRLHLKKMSAKDPAPVDCNEKKFSHRDWAPGEFEQFQIDVKKHSEDFWNATKFCVVPPDDYKGLDWPPDKPAFRLNVDCRFEIVWPQGERDSHASIECYRLDADKNPGFRSFVRDAENSTNTGAWSNFDTQKGCGLTCSVDVHKGWVDEEKILPITEKLSLEQITVVHEVGHLLGLPHPGVFRKTPACLKSSAETRSTGAPSCYNGNSPYDQANVMGVGMRLESWNGMPWWHRLSEHTGTVLTGWNISRESVAPKVLSQKPVPAPPVRQSAAAKA